MSNLARQLAELQKLRDSGSLSLADYDRLLLQLLGQASGGSAGSAPSLGEAQDALIPPAFAGLPGDVGAYRILGEVGRGGMGVVYRARHSIGAKARKQGGDVALKLMHPQFAHDPIYRERFVREAAVVMDLEHPEIVKVLDMVKDGDQLALIMELIEGETLSARQRREPLRWQAAVEGFRGLLPAVRLAHNSGVVHRDLKPSNVMVTPAGTWKVMDFGLAKAGAGPVSELTLTLSQRALGTAAYMAPEQARNARDVDARADVFSLGVMFWELLVGQAPWRAVSTPYELDDLKRDERLVVLADLPEGVPSELGEVARTACRAKPSDRYSSIAAMETAISLALENIERRTELMASVVRDGSSNGLESKSNNSREIDGGEVLAERGAHRHDEEMERRQIGNTDESAPRPRPRSVPHGRGRQASHGADNRGSSLPSQEGETQSPAYAVGRKTAELPFQKQDASRDSTHSVEKAMKKAIRFFLVACVLVVTFGLVFIVVGGGYIFLL